MCIVRGGPFLSTAEVCILLNLCYTSPRRLQTPFTVYPDMALLRHLCLGLTAPERAAGLWSLIERALLCGDWY